MKLTVRTTQGRCVRRLLELEVYGAPPNVLPSEARDGDAQRAERALDASGMHDPDSAITGHEWDFGDGTGVAAGPVTNDYAYAAAGTYSVRQRAHSAAGRATVP